MPTSKATTNTVTKIALDAIPPSFSSNTLFCFPIQNAAYNPAEIRIKQPKLSLIEIDPLIPEDHETNSERLNSDDLDYGKVCAKIIRARFGKKTEREKTGA